MAGCSLSLEERRGKQGDEERVYATAEVCERVQLLEERLASRRISGRSHRRSGRRTQDARSRLSRLVVAGHDRDRTPDDFEDGEPSRSAPRPLKSTHLPTMSLMPCTLFPHSYFLLDPRADHGFGRILEVDGPQVCFSTSQW